MKNGVKWKPAISFFCILASLFFVSSLFSMTTGSIIVGTATASLSLFAGLLPDHYNIVKGFWFDKILSPTHTFFIRLFLFISLVSIFFFLKNYKLSIKIESRTP